MTDKENPEELDITIVDMNHRVPRWLRRKFNERSGTTGGAGKTFQKLIEAFVERPEILDAPLAKKIPLSVRDSVIQVPPMLPSGLIGINEGPSCITEEMLWEPEFLHVHGTSLNCNDFMEKFADVLARRYYTQKRTVISVNLYSAPVGIVKFSLFDEASGLALKLLGAKIRYLKSQHLPPVSGFGEFEVLGAVPTSQSPYHLVLTPSIAVTVPDMTTGLSGELEFIFRPTDTVQSVHAAYMRRAMKRHSMGYVSIAHLLDQE
ncbi:MULTISPECIES: hypothetical protein [Rhizobium]|uniref:hypothetical protein n=1 Tax=Rhizobium TaxID=379 RepID=UPI0013BB9D04|nr:hypothetical protein [Rhizobium ruizarguesonis]NEJ15529.1 hypothetical protein [Rhizobium ruizarguesonis]NEK29604.1 hypothetical protein [Rhizobium ruizarguesonis]